MRARYSEIDFFTLVFWTSISFILKWLSFAKMSVIYTLQIIYIYQSKTLQDRDVLVNFGDLLLETSKSSASWDVGGNSNQ